MKVQKKKIKKSLQDLKKRFTFAPRKTRKLIERLEGKVEKQKRKKKLQKFFKFFLQETKRISSFAPALRNKRNKKETHVRRHIELTAVLREASKQKK